ncbi:hypothetical protein FRC06_009347, partial [Ceratobasidium sp. 370]
ATRSALLTFSTSAALAQVGEALLIENYDWREQFDGRVRPVVMECPSDTGPAFIVVVT